MKDSIELISNYGEISYLEKVPNEDKTYMFKTECSYRYGKIHGKSFIDPLGGPMIIEGSFLEEANSKVKSIFHIKGGCIIIFE